MAKGQSHLHCWASGVFFSAFNSTTWELQTPDRRVLNPQLQPWLHLLDQNKNPLTLRHMDRETTQMCCLKDPQGSVAPKCQSSPQVRLHSPVLQHRGDGQGSSSFLRLPRGRCEWGEGRRPAGPGSCGAALGTPEGTALPRAHLRAQPLATALPPLLQGEQPSHARPSWGGHRAWL